MVTQVQIKMKIRIDKIISNKRTEPRFEVRIWRWWCPFWRLYDDPWGKEEFSTYEEAKLLADDVAVKEVKTRFKGHLIYSEDYELQNRKSHDIS